MKAFYCVGTHWDREWYVTFQEFRMWLVELIDELMELMDRDPEYKNFHLDGQAVVLQDYVEVRPEKRALLEQKLREGRLIAGPWYDLPDEWLVSGESFVRNLMMGLRVCRQFDAPPLAFAYTPDQFGHVAALPMIMAGFGLRAGIFWRGGQDENFPAQFVWVGPDGSRMVTHKIIDRGSYGEFDFEVRTHVKKVGITDELFTTYFEKYIAMAKERSPIELALMLDAIDHQRPDPIMPQLLAELKRRYPDIDFKWASLAEYGEEMLKHAASLPERSGEMREPCRDAHRVGQYLIVHTISSRYPLKQRNDQCQALLEKWVEPYCLFQLMQGGAPILSYVDKAWEYLLRNHPHDSICGCSIDQVHRDMMYRFDQCSQIGDGVVRRAVAQVGNATDAVEALRHVTVHNPLPHARRAVVDLALNFPADWPNKYIDGLTTGEMLNKFVLTDGGGVRLPFQMSRIERNVDHKVLAPNGRMTHRIDDVYHVAVDMELPASGYTGLNVEPTLEGTRNFGSLMTGPLSASNGQVTFALNADGTGRLEAWGRVYDGLFLYEDCGDAGDGWTRGQLINDIVYRTPGSRVTTAVDENGPLRTVFRVERVFDLPDQMDRKTYWRADRRRALLVTDYVIVEKHVPYVRVRTRVENTCMDHRFRVLFPTGVDAAVSFAETPFAVVERDVVIPADAGNWHERINPEKAFTSFFGVQDAKGGLAVLAPFGLHEYEVLETPERTLALTLFRSYFKTVMTAGEPDGQLQQTLEYEYLLYPFTGAFDAAAALRLVAERQAEVRFHYAAETPSAKSFFRADGDGYVVTAIKPAADGPGGVVRLWNPGAAPAHAELTFAVDVASACLCNLNEEPGQPVAVAGSKVAVTVPPRGLTSVKVTW